MKKIISLMAAAVLALSAMPATLAQTEPTIKVDGTQKVQTVDVKSRKPVTGKHDVYILFRGGDEQLFDFDWWKMNR